MNTCAACGHGSESVASGGSRGSLVLYEMSDGSQQWLHRVCAEPALAKVAQTLPPALFRRDYVPTDAELRHLRQRVWGLNAALGDGAA